jgi:predicted alpha/beta hydrolase
VVIINPATAVKASYYHRYAQFLAQHEMAVLTYDYRGIGESGFTDLRRHKKIAKLDWGLFDCDAALTWAIERYPNKTIHVVAHSIGGLLVGLARHNSCVTRCLMIGSQYAYWRDYRAGSRLSMWLRWHLIMPLLTLALGYFPARRLGWHEDLPASAAYEWAFRSPKLEDSYRGFRQDGRDPLSHFDTMTGEILSMGFSDDPFGTPAALTRLLDYFKAAKRTRLEVVPERIGEASIGHFAFFNDRFRQTLWSDSLQWLLGGEIPLRIRSMPDCQTVPRQHNIQR